MLGQVVAHYEIVEKLGEGGMGIVYKARDRKLDRLIALKFLPQHLTADPTEVERFQHEARASAALMHHNICVIHEIGEHEGQTYLAMEYLEGKTLKQVVADESPLAIRRVLEIAIQIADGLAAAHERGVVHRDIKSENIMLTPKGEVKIMDFGLAKLKGASKLTKAGSTLGTAAYMSPEQARGEEVDHRTDLFSFGVILYELLTNHLPFRGDHQAAMLYALVNEDPAPIARFNEKATPDLERIVQKALAKDRNDRYQHADDMLADLRRERKALDYAKTGTTITPVAAPRTTPPANVTRNLLVRYGIPAAVILALVLILAVVNPFNFQLNMTKSTAAEKNSLAVLYFQNIPDPPDRDHTGDMLTDLLTTSLSQSKALEVISRERLYDIEKELGQGELKTISPAVASQLAKRAGVSMMLLGSILQREPDLAITARVVDVATGKILSSQRISGFAASRMFALVDTLSLLLQKDLASKDSPQPEAKSVADITTSSPEAYRSYLEGVELTRKFYLDEAQSALKRAIQLDSNFAMAYFELGSMYESNDELRYSSMRKAWELRQNVSEKERLRIEADYMNFVEGKPADAASILEDFVKKYPHELGAYQSLAAAYGRSGQTDKVLRTFELALANDSLNKDTWNALAYEYAGDNRRTEALRAINRYIELAPGEANPYDSKGEVFFIMGEIDSAAFWYSQALALRRNFSSAEKLGNIAIIHGNDSSAAAYYQQFGLTADAGQHVLAELDRAIPLIHQGKLRMARQQYRAVLATLANQTAVRHSLPDLLRILISLDAELGDYGGMVADARQFVDYCQRSRTDNLQGLDLLAWALGKAGDKSAEAEVLRQIEQAIRRQTAPELRRYEFVQALSAYNAGDWKGALRYFQEVFKTTPVNRAPQLYYGVALLKAGNMPDALHELQRATWWSPISLPPVNLTYLPTNLGWPIAVVKAHYWLGVAYEQQGDKLKAVQEYRAFMDSWKDADFKSAELIDARSRLATLDATAKR